MRLFPLEFVIIKRTDPSSLLYQHTHR